MRIYMTIVLLLLFSSCALFKRSNKSADESSESMEGQSKLSSNTDVETYRQLENSLARSDSTHSTYRYVLWPKGSIQFSPGGSFAGEFDSVKIDGDLLQQTNVNTKNSMNAHATDRTKTNLNQWLHLSNDKKKSVTTSIYDVKWIIAFFIIFLTAFVWALKRGR